MMDRRSDRSRSFEDFKGLENIDPNKFFRLSHADTAGHYLTLFKPTCHLDCHKYAFSYREIRTLNINRGYNSV
jgi:hypothetical protein